MGAEDDLVRLQQSHHRRFLGVQDAAGDLVGEAWDVFAGLDDTAAASFSAAAATVVDAAKLQTSTIAVGYMTSNDRIVGAPAAGLVPTLPTIRGGIPATDVYHRSIVEARARVAGGASFDEAMASGRARAVATARTDVSLANRAEITRGGTARPWVVGYRRVLTGRSCAFCATASTQRYHSADLLPLHPSCDCDVGEIFGTADPGRIINADLLDQLKAAADKDGRPAYWDGPYVVDRDGAIRYRRERTLLGPDGTPLRDAAGEIRRTTVAGDKVQVASIDHGELGPTLGDARHTVTVSDDVADATGPARRTRANLDDPDVLAEASRRNVSPQRVLEIRDEKAQRRFLEDRARREAARSISADSPEVRAVADRFGVDPDDVLSARTRVADVRKVAREEAARVQADTIRELERMDAVRLRNPPRVGARTDLGSSARRGEWDWLEQVSDREKARLSRKWYDGTLAPDQMAANMSEALGRDLSTDEAMDLWMRLNRQHEAAGALRRGKLPSLDAYSGEIDPADLLHDLAAEGYDPTILFGDDLTAAGHVAQVERDLVHREALDYLGDAANPIEGPSPYRMGYLSWEEEVRDLEYALEQGTISPVGRRRWAELVPQYLDEPGLDFENLYARIVSTARRAGEEVPDYARIPW